MRVWPAVISIFMLLIGWAAGRAQAPAQPAFEIRVNAPTGETTIECVRGCTLAWVQRGVIPSDVPQSTFTYSCSGAAAPPRCGSGLIGGWLTP
jgi:hypothetical protein